MKRRWRWGGLRCYDSIAMEYRIGDFSLVSRLSVKTLRYYHEVGILEPARIDPITGYRWYDDESLRKAALVKRLRELDFSLEEIADIARLEAEGRTDEGLARLAAKAREMGERIERFQRIKVEIDGFIAAEREAEEAGDLEPIESIDIDGQLVAKIGYRGKYSDMGPYIGAVYRTYGRWATGPCFALYGEAEYSDEAAIDVCLPLKPDAGKAAGERDEAKVELLPGCRAFGLVHRGPYERIGDSYRRLFGELRENGLGAGLPIREIYLIGPGTILPRSPKSFRTRIVVPIAE